MSADIDKLVSDLESTATNIAVQEIISYAAANIWSGFASAFVSPIVGWFIGIVIDILMQKLDWLSYMLVEDWQTTQEGVDYANAAKNLSSLPTTATPDEIAAAQQAKIDAFKRLVGLGSPTP